MNKSETNNVWKFPPVFFLTVFAAVIGFFAGFFIRTLFDNKPPSPIIEKRESGHIYINPLLECDMSSELLKSKELTSFADDIKENIEVSIDKRMVDVMSVYFRELNDGLWFSINDKERFNPASMRKVPMMIALLRQAEEDEGFLSKEVPFKLMQDYDDKQNFKPALVLTPGEKYTVEELIRRMIVYSDNNAYMLASSIVNPGLLRTVYSQLRMMNPDTNMEDDYMSVFTYASFFRILYNASYLNREMSEKALSYLASSDFKFGIVSGIPSLIPSSHKFGEYSDEGTGVKQLHDCGIIYYPQHPYLLCIMSMGTDFGALETSIASVSQMVFNHVNEQHLKDEHR